jgi:hypothetical protein
MGRPDTRRTVVYVASLASAFLPSAAGRAGEAYGSVRLRTVLIGCAHDHHPS